MRAASFFLALAAASLAAFSAAAQDGAPLDFLAPKPDFVLPSPDQMLTIPVPYAPAQAPGKPGDGIGTEVLLEARLVAGGDPLSQGVTWRVFGAEADGGGALPLVATARGGTTSVQLPPGSYLVHAAFGRAGATKRVTVGRDAVLESVVLDAGGLRLGAVVGDERPVPEDRLSFEIAREDESGERTLVLPQAKPGLILRLPAGTYQVVSRYGNVNVVARAEIVVEPGKLTEAVLRHAGAEATLKLVAEAGGEALANTSWTVLTNGGDTVHESVGAFPRIVLAEGTYTAVARHKDQIYARDFAIEPGLDRDVEVRLSDVVRPDDAFDAR